MKKPVADFGTKEAVIHNREREKLVAFYISVQPPPKPSTSRLLQHWALQGVLCYSINYPRDSRTVKVDFVRIPIPDGIPAVGNVLLF